MLPVLYKEVWEEMNMVSRMNYPKPKIDILRGPIVFIEDANLLEDRLVNK